MRKEPIKLCASRVCNGFVQVCIGLRNCYRSYSVSFANCPISVIKHKKTPPKLYISTKIIRCTQKHLQGIVLCTIMSTDEQINATTAHNFSLLVDCVLLFTSLVHINTFAHFCTWKFWTKNFAIMEVI